MRSAVELKSPTMSMSQLAVSHSAVRHRLRASFCPRVPVAGLNISMHTTTRLPPTTTCADQLNGYRNHVQSVYGCVAHGHLMLCRKRSLYYGPHDVKLFPPAMLPRPSPAVERATYAQTYQNLSAVYKLSLNADEILYAFSSHVKKFASRENRRRCCSTMSDLNEHFD